MRLLVLMACTGLMGCATPYQERGWLGGVHAARLTNDTAQITAQGNGYTAPDRIERYVLRKAAEETLKDGFGHFEIITDRDRTQTAVVTSPGSSYTTAQATGYGNYATGTSTTYRAPSTSRQITEPGETIVIHMYAGPKPASAPANVYDAAELIKYLADPASP